MFQLGGNTMLVLSRKIREQILIPGLNIKVTVLSVGQNRVQLGIEAPAHIDITRPEANRPPSRLEFTVEHNAEVSAVA